MHWAVRVLLVILLAAVLWPIWIAVSTTLGARTLVYEM